MGKGTIVAGAVALVAVASLLVMGVVLFGDADDDAKELIIPILTVVGLAVPSLLALAKSEAIHHDIKNGVVRDKAREGAHDALDETGVTELVKSTNHGETTAIALQGIKKLLERVDTQTGGPRHLANPNEKDQENG